MKHGIVDVRTRTAERTAGPRKGFPVVWVLLGVAVVVVAVLATLLISQRGGETIRVSPMEQRIGEKLASGQALTAQEQAAYERMQREGVAIAEKFLKQNEVAPVAPTGSWTKEINTNVGPVTVKLIIPDPVIAGKVTGWIQGRYFYGSQKEKLNLLVRWIERDASGNILWEGEGGWTEGQTNHAIDPEKRTRVIEIRVEKE